MLFECAFGCLKGCWCTLTTYLKLAKAKIPQVIVPACVLHNNCEASGELLHEALVKKAWYTEDA